jgi:hypothetical protein
MHCWLATWRAFQALSAEEIIKPLRYNILGTYKVNRLVAKIFRFPSQMELAHSCIDFPFSYVGDGLGVTLKLKESNWEGPPKGFGLTLFDGKYLRKRQTSCYGTYHDCPDTAQHKVQTIID